jgi:riboflavin kinase/FMN adenylyltransferase
MPVLSEAEGSAAPRHVIDRFKPVAGQPHVVTIGNFDGVHRGHQYLLGRVVERARELDVAPLVITFEPHPVSVLRPESPLLRLTLPATKNEEIARCGVDSIVVIPFDLEFAALTAEEFLDLIRLHADPREIVVGEDFRFGKGRVGDGDYIADYARRYGFSAQIITRLGDEADVVSSSRIRDALSSGQADLAAQLLGRRYRLTGVVERGFARGRELGFPTANLMVVGELLVPASGIYAGYVHIDDPQREPHAALVYIGTSPTFEPRERIVEAHILDFDDDLYARTIEIEFVSYVRGDQRFESAEALIAQIRRDEIVSRSILADSPPEPDRRVLGPSERVPPTPCGRAGKDVR